MLQNLNVVYQYTVGAIYAGIAKKIFLMQTRANRRNGDQTLRAGVVSISMAVQPIRRHKYGFVSPYLGIKFF